MGTLSTADQKRVSAQIIQSSRSSGVAAAGSSAAAAVATIDLSTSGAAVNINHRARVFVMTAPPTSTGTDPIVPKPMIGDIALVYMVDTAASKNPVGFLLYVYTPTVNATTGAASADVGWKKVALS